MSMLKKVSVILMLLILSACTSQPGDKRFKGAGDFDKVEAAKTRVSLGLTYLKNGSFSQAKFNLDKALEFDPRSGSANFGMAFYYQQVDEVKRAHEYYKKAIDFSGDDPDVLNSYGAFLCKQGDYAQAKRYFMKAVNDKSYVSTASTYENLAICAQSQGLIEESIAYFNSALNHQPTLASSLLYLSQLYVQTQQWDAAKKTVWKYERNSNVSDESLWLSFQIAQGQQDLGTAVEYAEILKRLYPSNVNTLQALAALGKFQPDMTVTRKSRATVKNIAPVDTITMADVEASNALANASKRDTQRLPQEPLTALASTSTAKTKLIDSSAETLELEVSKAQNDTESALQAALDKADIGPTENESVIDATQAAVDTTAVNALDEPDNDVISKQIPFHIVTPKENLYRISLKYNVKIKKLLEWNNLQDASAIRIGTKLWLRDPNTNE
jgi:type IV pilus assembly protein PilF